MNKKNEKKRSKCLSKEAYIKIETRNLLLSIYFIVIGTALFDGIITGLKPTYILALILFLLVSLLVLSYPLKKVLNMLVGYNFNRIESVKLVNQFLTSEKYTEVFPIFDTTEYTVFSIALDNFLKFYAIVKNRNEVSVYIQIKDEQKYHFLEDIPKEAFSLRYKLQN